ncbi:MULTISPECIES: GntR family transcriptional regulator [Lacticaseibacillus]|uniref:GntR family transcriptional regulator n=1 Tax=Lacticaseibacillus zeae subsp. silagei TaxID=3068307 RepID=A0ABD7Z6S5_LACZE|nr:MULTISPECIES: GntR family transcriptional regulator [Lacticaseibacillus]OFS00513.1 GntR family transcriptional regulator [Lactobacillus sp. HMSC068F07]MDE3282810.1 GntR family transcriptional regulator [Lacticaseibacillus casei]MDE3315611.1 GntR family transcriptional regulator [Lacticaseibacillus zeae]WLV82671.1 GntR family transcriptional regulator [Lacticaseibacillus sp. NCIMB 15475]WLV87499.1 GntR family transcriptional regulator [Lacticaseibacillus sp. NCIMB 15474]
MEFDDKVPIYLQIKQYLYQAIITDRLKSGAQLPAVRQLAAELTVNVNTVQRALSELIQEGVLVTRRGRGNFVTDDIKVLIELKNRVIATELGTLYRQLDDLNLSAAEMKDAFAQYVDEQEAHHDHE